MFIHPTQQTDRNRWDRHQPMVRQSGKFDLVVPHQPPLLAPKQSRKHQLLHQQQWNDVLDQVSYIRTNSTVQKLREKEKTNLYITNWLNHILITAYYIHQMDKERQKKNCLPDTKHAYNTFLSSFVIKNFIYYNTSK